MGKVIVEDGIINEEEWEKADPKVLFILKESYGWQEGYVSEKMKKIFANCGDDAEAKYLKCFAFKEDALQPDAEKNPLVGVKLAQLLNDYENSWSIDFKPEYVCKKTGKDGKKVTDSEGVGRSPTWCRLAEWIKGMEDVKKNNAISSFKQFHYGKNVAKKDLQSIQEYLQKCAFVNLNRISGKSESKDVLIQEELEKNLNKLKEDITQIDPDVIVCCGTFKYIDKAGNTDSPRSIILNDPNGKKYFSKYKPGNGCWIINRVVSEDKKRPAIVLSVPHPTARIPAFFSYYGVCALYQQALKAL